MAYENITKGDLVSLTQLLQSFGRSKPYGFNWLDDIVGIDQRQGGDKFINLVKEMKFYFKNHDELMINKVFVPWVNDIAKRLDRRLYHIKNNNDSDVVAANNNVKELLRANYDFPSYFFEQGAGQNLEDIDITLMPKCYRTTIINRGIKQYSNIKINLNGNFFTFVVQANQYGLVNSTIINGKFKFVLDDTDRDEELKFFRVNFQSFNMIVESLEPVGNRKVNIKHAEFTDNSSLRFIGNINSLRLIRIKKLRKISVDLDSNKLTELIQVKGLTELGIAISENIPNSSLILSAVSSSSIRINAKVDKILLSNFSHNTKVEDMMIKGSIFNKYISLEDYSIEKSLRVLDLTGSTSMFIKRINFISNSVFHLKKSNLADTGLSNVNFMSNTRLVIEDCIVKGLDIISSNLPDSISASFKGNNPEADRHLYRQIKSNFFNEKDMVNYIKYYKKEMHKLLETELNFLDKLILYFSFLFSNFGTSWAIPLSISILLNGLAFYFVWAFNYLEDPYKIISMTYWPATKVEGINSNLLVGYIYFLKFFNLFLDVEFVQGVRKYGRK